LHEAFLPFQKIIRHNFFESARHFIGADATDISERPRKVTLKSEKGPRVTIQEHDPLYPHVLHIYWLIPAPAFEDSEQLFCRVPEHYWINLIETSHRASTFIPLTPLIVIQPETDNVLQLAITRFLRLQGEDS
jgi:hypothetical protein